MEKLIPKSNGNHSLLSRETIESALSQPYPNTAIVFVDGSTADAWRVLESYRGRVKVTEQPGGMKKGQSAAINLAMRPTPKKLLEKFADTQDNKTK